MDKFKMYLREIESNKQSLSAFIKKRGFVENLGQIEYRNFLDKINVSDIDVSKKADLASRFIDMLNNLEN